MQGQAQASVMLFEYTFNTDDRENGTDQNVQYKVVLIYYCSLNGAVDIYPIEKSEVQEFNRSALYT